MSKERYNNPVGLLNERYQMLGREVPEYQVVSGQGHTTVVSANLTVSEGIMVAASGSSRKMARKQGAVLMLDRSRDEDLELRGGREVSRNHGVKGGQGKGRSSPSYRPFVQS